jgi:hypothetical protein
MPAANAFSAMRLPTTVAALALPPLPGVAGQLGPHFGLVAGGTDQHSRAVGVDDAGVDVLIRPEDGEPTDPQLADLQPRLTGTAQTSLFLVHRL